MGKQSVAGIVVKVTDANIVLLCQDGTFQNVARPPRNAPPLIGERYTHIQKKVSLLKYTSIAAVFLLTFISYLLFPSGQGDSAYVVAIDINPSFELTVNDGMKVIETSANNPDGETLLAAIAVHGDQLGVAIEKIITYSEDTGFFLEGKYLTTSVIPVKEQKHQLTDEVERIIANSITKPDIDVVMLQNSKANYDEAKKSNLSVNHYAYYKELENIGVVKTIEEVKGKSMAELRKMQKAEKPPAKKAPDSNKPEKVSESNKPEKVSESNKPEKNNLAKPDSVGQGGKETKKAPNGNKPEKNNSVKSDSVGQGYEKTEKPVPPVAQSQVQENKQQAENRKAGQEKRAPQGQNNKSNQETSSTKPKDKQKERP